MEDKIKALFAKNRSGFRPSIGTLGAILFGIHCISLSSSGYIPFSWVASSWPGASIVGVLTISAVLALFHGYTFAAVGAAMPRAGADYVLASRFLNPTLAFLSSWIFVVFSGVVAGGLIAWIPKVAIPAIFHPMAIIYKNPTCDSISNFASSPTGILTIGLGFVIITAALMFLQNKVILRTMGIGLGLGLLAWIVIFYSLASTDAQTFRDSWNQFVGQTSNFGSFDQRLPLAQKAGMTITQSPWVMTLAGLIMGFWIYYGYSIPTFFSGEIREPSKSNALPIASATSVIVTWAIFTLGALLLQRLVPLPWIAAEGFISNNGEAVQKVAGQEVPAFPWITFYAALAKPNVWLVSFVALAWLYTLVNLAQTYFFYTSRIIFAWAFDRRIPSVFAHQTKTGCPPYCVVAIAFLAALGVVDASFNGPIGPQLTFIFFAATTQLVTLVALWRFPSLAPQQFRLLPPFVNGKLLGIPKLRLMISITMIYLLWIIVASFVFPAVGVANPAKTLALFAIIAGLGVTVFFAMRAYRRKMEGDSGDDVFKEIPPE